jgi:hypothetical protein
MPYKIVKSGSGFGVANSDTGKMHSKHTTKEKAMKQMRLLYMVESGKKPTGGA